MGFRRVFYPVKYDFKHTYNEVNMPEIRLNIRLLLEFSSCDKKKTIIGTGQAEVAFRPLNVNYVDSLLALSSRT